MSGFEGRFSPWSSTTSSLPWFEDWWMLQDSAHSSNFDNPCSEQPWVAESLSEKVVGYHQYLPPSAWGDDSHAG